MGAFDYDANGVHRFSFMLDGIECKNIKSIEGLKLSMEKIETKVNTATGLPHHRVFAANKVYLGQLIVTRIMTDDVMWHEWYDKALKRMPGGRQSGAVLVYSNGRGDGPEQIPIRTYEFTGGLPIDLTITGLNATTAAPLEETITFMYDEMTMTYK